MSVRAKFPRQHQTTRLKYIPVHVVTQLSCAFSALGLRVGNAGCWEKSLELSPVVAKFVLEDDALLQ